jgi:protein-disulfide isomerase
MPSGKRAREQRRQAATAAPPPVRSKGAGGARTRQASPRALGIAGGVVAVAVIAIVLGVVLGRSNGSNIGDSQTLHLAPGTQAVGSSTSPAALQGATDVAKMFKGIPENHFVLGKPTAPVELTEFIDLQCPVCQQFETTELPTLLQKYVRTGKLRIKMEPWSILDRPGTGVVDSDRGQKATIAAAAQNKAFEFAEVLYFNQGTEDSNWLNDSMVSQIAASVDGLNTAQLVSDANSSATKTLVNAVDSRAAAIGAKIPAFNGTPSLLLAKGNGKPHYYGTGSPAMDLSNLEPAINALLK